MNDVSAVVEMVNGALMQQRLTLVQEIKDIYSLNVKKEIQKMTGSQNILRKNSVPQAFRPLKNFITINIPL